MTDKFYRLTHDEWLGMMALKPAQLKVLYYLRTLEPFGDRAIELTMTEAAIALQMNKSSVSRALKALAELDYIDLELIKVRITIKPKGCTPETELHPDNSVAPTQRALHPRNERCTHATSDAPTQRAMHPRNERPPEPIPCKDLGSSQTIQTYSDYSDSLRSEMRESFEKFCLKKMEDAPFAIASPQAWLNKHWPEYWTEFEKKYAGTLATLDGAKSSGKVDDEFNKIQQMLMTGEIEDFEKSAQGYLVRCNGGWIEWERFEAGDRPDAEAYRAKLAATRAQWEKFKGGEPCR